MKPAALQLAIMSVVALLAIAGYVLWYEQVTALDAEAAGLVTEIAAKDAERTRSASARSAEADLAAQEAFVASHLVATGDIVAFLEGLEATGRAYGATLRVASVTGGENSPEGRISLSLSIAGSFDAVMRTVGAIESGPYAGMVQDLSLDTPDGETWSATGIFIIGTASTP